VANSNGILLGNAGLTDEVAKSNTVHAPIYRLAAWAQQSATFEDTDDTTTLGTLPAGHMVTRIHVWVETAFDSGAGTQIKVGTAADDGRYTTNFNAAHYLNQKSWEFQTHWYWRNYIPATSYTHTKAIGQYESSSQTVIATLVNASSTATEGECLIVIEYSEVPAP